MPPPKPGSLQATFAPRVRLGGYELLLELARGGVATAIVARKIAAGGFERLVVIKRVHRNLLANDEFSKMFRDEARIASSVRHPNVASVIDVIESGPELCLVMEYFEALSLSSLVAAAGPQRHPSPRVVSRIMSDALGGLHAAHEATDLRNVKLGIVHRDFSPQNIICDTDGVSRVIDFGIAKATSRLTSTKAGIVKGKVAYMAPEQIESLPLDRRTDIFAAGIVLHELLTGRGLFTGGDEFATMRRILRGEVPPPSSIATDVSPALDAVVRQALERAPKGRFPTALAFQAALERAMPPASTREVGAWVQSVGGTTLYGRRTDLLAMLSKPASEAAADAPAENESSPALLFVDPATVTGETGGIADEPVELPGVSGRRGRMIGLGAAILVLGAAVGAIVHAR